MKGRLSEKLMLFGFKSIGHLSPRNIYRLALLVNFIVKPFPLRVKKTIRRNLERCFPALSVSERELLEKQSLLHTFWRILEMPFFWFADIKAVKAMPLQVVGDEQFQQDFNLGRGIIFIAAHFGSWEVPNYYFGAKYPSATLYKPLKYAYQEELINLARHRYGVEFFKTSATGVKKLFMALKQGKCISIMSDHDPGKNGGIVAPFFDVPAQTMLLPIKFIQKTQAPVYTLSATRLPAGRGFRLRFQKIEDRQIRNVPIEAAAKCMNQAIEEMIMQAPEQYEWSYKRFRRTPTTTGKGFYE